MAGLATVAALYVRRDGPYAVMPGVDLWDEARDARTYRGPYPAVAHPPCARWGKYWAGGPAWRGEPKRLGDDGGCFLAALAAVRRWGGVIEHPEGSHAWRAFNIAPPRRGRGWERAGIFVGGWTCCVEQGQYGHRASKATWLYAYSLGGKEPPRLLWPARRTSRATGPKTDAERRASRTGVCQRLSRRQRELTPPEMAAALVAIARACGHTGEEVA